MTEVELYGVDCDQDNELAAVGAVISFVTDTDAEVVEFPAASAIIAVNA